MPKAGQNSLGVLATSSSEVHCSSREQSDRRKVSFSRMHPTLCFPSSPASSAGVPRGKVWSLQNESQVWPPSSGVGWGGEVGGCLRKSLSQHCAAGQRVEMETSQGRGNRVVLYIAPVSSGNLRAWVTAGLTGSLPSKQGSLRRQPFL